VFGLLTPDLAGSGGGLSDLHPATWAVAALHGRDMSTRLSGNGAPGRRGAPLRGRCVAALLATVTIASLAGCGASGTGNTQPSLTSDETESAAEPFTPQQRRVEQGAHLIVSDGCAACHLMRTGQNIGPSLARFAGHDVTLASGRRVLVDERFLREVLRNPRRDPIRGYDPTLMVKAVEPLHLRRRPQQVAALAAFIEQIGPETG
jgi:hypothetical protein